MIGATIVLSQAPRIGFSVACRMYGHMVCSFTTLIAERWVEIERSADVACKASGPLTGYIRNHVARQSE
jgi:hypothetical protein